MNLLSVRSTKRVVPLATWYGYVVRIQLRAKPRSICLQASGTNDWGEKVDRPSRHILPFRIPTSPYPTPVTSSLERTSLGLAHTSTPRSIAPQLVHVVRIFSIVPACPARGPSRTRRA